MQSENYDAGKKAENNSWDIMSEKGFHRPTKGARANIKKAFEMFGKKIESRGFDLIDAKYKHLLDDPNKIYASISEGSFVLYELKTAGANRKSDVESGFGKGFGFTLTKNEEHNHSVLGDGGYKFIFLNLKTGECILLHKGDFYEKARIIPTKSIFMKESVTNGILL